MEDTDVWARLALHVLLAAAGGLSATPAAAQAKFEDATVESGLIFHHRNSKTPRKYLPEAMSGGVAIIDYNGDGWMDVFFVNGAEIRYPHSQGVEPDKSSPAFWNRMYRNNGDGTFRDVTGDLGLQGRGYGMGAAVGDVDNDGFPDLVVTRVATGDEPALTIYRNDAGLRFVDVTAQSGVRATGWATSAGFFDYDRDGDLDLFAGRYMKWRYDVDRGCGLDSPAGRTYCHPDLFEPVSSLLFRNDGGFRFADVTASSGIGAHPGKALGVAFADFNADGYPDIAVANDSHPQFLFRNRGDGTFSEEATLSGSAYDADGGEFAGMGIVAGDLDGDGRPDLLITTLSQQRYAFFRNLDGELFEYRTDDTGLGRITRLLSGWGLWAADFDRDETLDVAIANGHVMDNIERSQPLIRYLQPPMLLSFDGRRFVDRSASAGELFRKAGAGRGLAVADLDNDGDLDFVISNLNGPAIFGRNKTDVKAWVGVRLRGRRSNRDGIGARVEFVRADGSKPAATVSPTGSYLSSGDPRVFVGAEPGREVVSVRVHWPSGLEQRSGPLAAGRIHELVEKE